MKIKNLLVTRENKTVYWICQMQFFWGMASSMVFSLLPVFIVEELGGSKSAFGLLEGAVIFLSFMGKLFAGFLIDIVKKKLPMLKLGTILTVVGKLLLSCAPNVFFVCLAKSIDRFSKGLRHAPFDAILGEVSNSKKGLAYYYRYTMELSGFFVGSIITSMIVNFLGRNFRLIFALAIIPTLLSYHILQNKLDYREKVPDLSQSQDPQWKIRDIKLMPKDYWRFILAIALLMFNKFNEGFLTLRSMDVLPEYVSEFPILMLVYEACAICVSILIGKLVDRFDKRNILLVGCVLLIIADMFGIFSNGGYSIIAMYVFAGMHLGATQGVIGSVIARCAPSHLIGTAFAIYYAISGIILLASNTIAGFSSKVKFLGEFVPSSSMPFVFGMIFSLLSMGYVVYWKKTLRSRRP